MHAAIGVAATPADGYSLRRRRPDRGRKGDRTPADPNGAGNGIVEGTPVPPFRIVSKGQIMRTTFTTALMLTPSGAFAHAGHPTGSGHDLWLIAAAFAVAALYGIFRKA